jgi:hypothetical protein
MSPTLPILVLSGATSSHPEAARGKRDSALPEFKSLHLRRRLIKLTFSASQTGTLCGRPTAVFTTAEAAALPKI